jgi:hypothetical protein
LIALAVDIEPDALDWFKRSSEQLSRILSCPEFGSKEVPWGVTSGAGFVDAIQDMPHALTNKPDDWRTTPFHKSLKPDWTIKSVA